MTQIYHEDNTGFNADYTEWRASYILAFIEGEWIKDFEDLNMAIHERDYGPVEKPSKISAKELKKNWGIE